MQILLRFELATSFDCDTIHKNHEEAIHDNDKNNLANSSSVILSPSIKDDESEKLFHSELKTIKFLLQSISTLLDFNIHKHNQNEKTFVSFLDNILFSLYPFQVFTLRSSIAFNIEMIAFFSP
jgi:hypothetical protein